MDSPFQTLSTAFQTEYTVNFCVQGPDGSILMTLSDDTGIALRHLIEGAQWRDPQWLQSCIAAVRDELTSRRG